MSTVDYEFVFPSGSFDQTVYDACVIPDLVGDRAQVIQDTVVQIQGIFNNSVLNLHLWRQQKYPQHKDLQLYYWKKLCLLHLRYLRI